MVMDSEETDETKVPLLVCKVTHEEHCHGYEYNRSEPFVINDVEHWPPQRGTWFHVPGTKYAIQAWANARGETAHLHKQLKLAAKRDGAEAPDLRKVSSKTLRRTMATIMSQRVSMQELMSIGEWSSEAMARRYIATLNVFAAGSKNYTDIAFGIDGK